MWMNEMLTHGVQVETTFGDKTRTHYLVDPRQVYPDRYEDWPWWSDKVLVLSFGYEANASVFHYLVQGFRENVVKRNSYLDKGRLNVVLLDNITYVGPGFSVPNSGRPPSRTRRGKRHKFTLEGLHVPEENA